MYCLSKLQGKCLLILKIYACITFQILPPSNCNVFGETFDNDSYYRFAISSGLQSQTGDNNGIDKSPIDYGGTGLGTS